MEGSGKRADALGFLCLSGIQGTKLSGGQCTSLSWRGIAQRCAWLKGSCGFVKQRFGEGLGLALRGCSSNSPRCLLCAARKSVYNEAHLEELFDAL